MWKDHKSAVECFYFFTLIMPYNRSVLYIILSILMGATSVVLLRFSSESAMLYLLLTLLLNGFIISVLPLSQNQQNKIGVEFLIKNIPYCFIGVILPFLLKPTVPVQLVLYSLLVLIVMNTLLMGSFILMNSLCKTIIAQIITIMGFLVLIGGIFLVPSFTVLLDSYDKKNELYQLFAQINPAIVICNIFDVDPFHKDQLYHLFGSSFLVPKTNIFKSIMLWALAAALIWMVYFFWVKKTAEVTTTNEKK